MDGLKTDIFDQVRVLTDEAEKALLYCEFEEDYHSATLVFMHKAQTELQSVAASRTLMNFAYELWENQATLNSKETWSAMKLEIDRDDLKLTHYSREEVDLEASFVEKKESIVGSFFD